MVVAKCAAASHPAISLAHGAPGVPGEVRGVGLAHGVGLPNGAVSNGTASIIATVESGCCKTRVVRRAARARSEVPENPCYLGCDCTVAFGRQADERATWQSCLRRPPPRLNWPVAATKPKIKSTSRRQFPHAGNRCTGYVLQRGNLEAWYLHRGLACYVTKNY